MSNGVIAFLITVSACTWIYTKFMRSSGNNTKQTVIAVVFIGAILFFILFTILNLVLKSSPSS